MDTRFIGKSAFVTGAARGIGAAVAHRLAAEGAEVTCADLDADGASATAESIRAAGGRAIGVGVDVTDANAVQRVVDDAATAMDGLTVVCNIAGIGHFANTHEESPEDFARIIAVNVNGTFHVSRAALPHLLRGGGSIVNTASTAGIAAAPWSAAYSASKGGVVMLTKAMAWEYVKRGVRINAVAPGGVETDITKSFLPPADADLSLLGRIMTPLGMTSADAIAAVFAFVASDECPYMTGSVVVADGALTA